MYEEVTITEYQWVVMHEKVEGSNEHETRCNEVLPRDGIKLALDSMPTTEKEASLLVATHRGASNRPWCGTMAQGFGMGLLISGERGRFCNRPSRTPCDMPSWSRRPNWNDPFKMTTRTILMWKYWWHKKGWPSRGPRWIPCDADVHVVQFPHEKSLSWRPSG